VGQFEIQADETHGGPLFDYDDRSEHPTVVVNLSYIGYRLLLNRIVSPDI
jgi:hypothetical protein